MANRLVSMTVILLIAISLLAVVGVFVYKYLTTPSNIMIGMQNSQQMPTMENVEALSFATGEIMTSLADNRIVVMEFSLIANNKKAKKELEKGKILVKGEVISLLSSLKVEDLRSEEGINGLEARLIERVNELMHNGKVVKVVTTKKLFTN